MKSAAQIRAALKPWMLPIAMLMGIVLHDTVGEVAFLSRYFIFTMLLVTFCRVKVADLRPTRATWLLLAVQYIGSIVAYYALLPAGTAIAQTAFICVYCPTATAAPVVTGMLGGSVARVATYSLISHVLVALTAPTVLALLNPHAQLTFADSAMRIASMVLPLILGPLIIALALQAWAPRVHRSIAEHQGLSFYIWALSLIIVVANAVSFAMQEPPSQIPTEICMALVALAMCLLQFAIGRRIGRRYGDAVTCAQSLGQKNTVLAIWLAMTFLDPITSIGPAAYIVWHNSYNSWQIYRHEKSLAKQRR